MTPATADEMPGSPLFVDCPDCKAIPGTSCDFTSQKFCSHDGYHTSRWNAAKLPDLSGDPPTVAEFKKAVEDFGVN